MILCDICQNGDIWSKYSDIVQLKTADFYDIPFLRVLSHLTGNGNTDISDQCTIQSSMSANMVSQRGGGCFPVTSRYTQDPAASLMPISQFDFTNHRNTFTSYLNDQRTFIRYTRTFHYFVCFQNLFLTVFTFFEFYSFFNQNGFILLCDFSRIGNKYHIPFLGGQY